MHKLPRLDLGRLTAVVSVLACAACVCVTPSAQASLGDQLGLSPYWNWKTIESEHFRVTFPADLEETAQKETNYLEEAHSVLSPRLYWQPWRKTQILVIDNADLANGLTSAGRCAWGSCSGSRRRTRGSARLTTTTGCGCSPSTSTRTCSTWTTSKNSTSSSAYIFGDVAAAQLRLADLDARRPGRLHGDALHARRAGDAAPLRMILRTAVDDNVFDTSGFYKIDQFNGDTPYNPGGEAYYLFGYELINTVARTPAAGGRTADGLRALKDGEDALGVMSLRSASRLPYFIDGNLESIIGKNWSEVWEQWVGETRKRMTAQLDRIRSRPTTELERLTPSDGLQTIGPAISPNGSWLAYTTDTPDRRSGLYLLDLIGGRTRRLDDKSSGAQAAFTPDSRTIVYSAVQRVRNYYQFSDLLAYDLQSCRGYPLTQGLRARDPDVSPDGKWIAFTLTENETTGLASLRSGTTHAAANCAWARSAGSRPPRPEYDRVSAPRFSRDGKRISTPCTTTARRARSSWPGTSRRRVPPSSSPTASSTATRRRRPTAASTSPRTSRAWTTSTGCRRTPRPELRPSSPAT